MLLAQNPLHKPRRQLARGVVLKGNSLRDYCDPLIGCLIPKAGGAWTLLCGELQKPKGGCLGWLIGGNRSERQGRQGGLLFMMTFGG